MTGALTTKPTILLIGAGSWVTGALTVATVCAVGPVTVASARVPGLPVCTTGAGAWVTGAANVCVVGVTVCVAGVAACVTGAAACVTGAIVCSAGVIV